jgi:DNA-directed RNA polymerase subunit RPC12/RpoP
MLAQCPFCMATAMIDDRFAGQAVSCYACRRVYTAPNITLTVSCPHCGTPVMVQKQYAGTVMACAACARQFTAPWF